MRKVRWHTINKKILRINGGIRSSAVRVIDENNNQLGIIDTVEALGKAREVGLDLVEVAPLNDPPVCKIMDYGKWLYEQKRKEREAHKKNIRHSVTLKEIRLRPETDKHDVGIKLKHGREFLEKGHKLQFTIFFRGRQVLHRDKGFELLEYITESLSDISKIERPAKMNGKRMTLLLVPRKNLTAI